MNNAKSIQVFQDDVLICVGQFNPSCIGHRITPEEVILLYPNNWPYDYDFQCNLFPLASPQLRKCISETVLVDNVVSFATVPILRSISHYLTIIPDGSENNICIPPWHIMLSQLNKQGFVCWCQSVADEFHWHHYYSNIFKVSDGIRNFYVLFTAFLSPSDIMPQETALVSQYSNNAAYAKGIAEGWSILFFPEKYNNTNWRNENKYGIILQPGVIDRHELAAYIPPEYQKQAVENGKPFCFTDMTLAFPE